MTRSWMIAALIMGGCETSLNLRYEFSAIPGHSVGAELTLDRRDS